MAETIREQMTNARKSVWFSHDDQWEDLIVPFWERGDLIPRDEHEAALAEAQLLGARLAGAPAFAAITPKASLARNHSRKASLFDTFCKRDEGTPTMVEPIATHKLVKRPLSEIIEDAAREFGVDPNNLVFRARLTEALIAQGYFKNEVT